MRGQHEIKDRWRSKSDKSPPERQSRDAGHVLTQGKRRYSDDVDKRELAETHAPQTMDIEEPSGNENHGSHSPSAQSVALVIHGLVDTTW